MLRLRRSLPCFLLLLCLASTLAAQTTGSVVGRVRDTNGTALPGVTVEASGPALQGTRTAVTESDGSFRFPLLAPGVYTFQATLQGLGTVREANVAVALGRDTTLDIALRPSLAEDICRLAATTPPSPRSRRASPATPIRTTPPRTPSASTAPRVPRTPTTSTASTRRTPNTASRARSSTSSSSRKWT